MTELCGFARCRITRAGQVLDERMIPIEQIAVEQIGTTIVCENGPIEVAFTFDPPLITEIPDRGEAR